MIFDCFTFHKEFDLLVTRAVRCIKEGTDFLGRGIEI